jgi:hypothetical protein
VTGRDLAPRPPILRRVSRVTTSVPSRRRVLTALAGALAVLAVTTPAASAIVGGVPASRPYPAMGALEIDGSFTCGASLVRDRWALTAAHCVEAGPDGTPREPTTVRFGVTRLSDSRGERIAVGRIKIHESYGTPQESSNDVALLELVRTPASPTAPIRVVTASERDLWSPGTVATTIGWGGRSFPVLFGGSDDLLQVDVPIRADPECANAYRGTLGWDPQSMLCAGSGTGGRDSCQGDSGGPLMVFPGGEPVLIGTVSFGLGCGFPGLYGVYGRIGEPALADWIVRNAGPVPATAPPAADPAPAPRTVLGLRRASRRGRVLELTLVVRSPVRALTLSVERRRGSSTHRIARTTRTRLSSNRTIRLRVPASGPRRPLRIRVRAKDSSGRAVGFDRLLRTTG